MIRTPVSAGPVRPIRVTGELLADLGGGPSLPGTIAFLRSGQLAKHLHLLLFLVRTAPADRRPAADRAMAVIAAAQQAHPTVVDELLSSPFVGAWLSTAVRHRTTDHSYLDRLAGLAVTAGLRAGLAGELTVRTRDGVLDLPGIGRASGMSTTVPVGFADGRLSVDERRLERTRTLHLSAECAISFEDTDSYRNCYHVPAAARCGTDQHERWQTMLREAWELLVDRAPGYATELAAGLRAVVPLTAEPGSPDVSATSRIASGAVGLSFPRRPDHAAATLVHEFQHSKLTALLDLITLHSGDPTRRHFAPWRRDARPIGGLLQGAYAFIAVGDLWRRIGVDVDTLDASDRNFADLCEQLNEVLRTLRAAETFNVDGRRLVATLSERFDAWLGGAAPAAEAEAARARLDRHRRLWIEFNADHFAS